MELKGVSRVSAGSTEEEKRPSRKYDEEFRRAALERVKAGKDVVTLARELGVNHTQIYRWRNEALGRHPCRGLTHSFRRRAMSANAGVSRIWNAWLRDRPWNWIFSEVPCCASREIAGSRDRIPASRLRANPAR